MENNGQIDQETFLGATARVYALADMKVFPLWPVRRHGDAHICACSRGADCTSTGKHPIIPPAHKTGDPQRATCRGECGKLGHGLWDATDNVDLVNHWWRREPDANIGLPAHANGFAILDVDPRHSGNESFATLHAWVERQTGIDLMDTMVQRTGSGGMHLVYQAPEGGIKNGANVFGEDMPGLDTRGRGGYIVAWPSMHASGQIYEWVDFLRDPAPWPAVLTKLMDDSEPKTPTGPHTFTPMRSGQVSSGYATAALNKELEQLSQTPSGGRNFQLNRSAFALGQLVGAGLLTEHVVADELHRVARGIGLDESEIRKTIESGLAGGRAKPRNLERA